MNHVQTTDLHQRNPEENIRRDWSRSEAQALYDLPFADLTFRAQSIHRSHFDPNAIELASLLSIKTGGCPEDCGYCSQSAHYDTGLKATRLMDQTDVITAAEMPARPGSAWRRPGAIQKTAIWTMSARW